MGHFWGESVIPNFIPTVAGKVLKSRPLGASLHAASRSLPLGLSNPQPSSVSVLGAATTPVSASLRLCRCVAQSTGQSSLYRVKSNILPTPVQ